MMEMLWVNSKITIPRPVPNVIERKKLFTVLSNNRMKKLTIVRAPAGYGKTTLLSQWFSQIAEAVAWFSIDGSDNEPKRFLKYLIHTLSLGINGDLDNKLSPLIDKAYSFEFIVDAILHELDVYESNIHIVLDNFHAIQHPSIYEILIRLIEYLPSNVRIFITTRTKLSLPIANWHVKGWMLEVGTEQLCFDLEELINFFGDNSSNEYQIGELKQVLKKTEGWAAGIQFIKLSTAPFFDGQSSAELLKNASLYINEYFMQEILAPIALTTQDFLIRNSILNRLEPDICNAITSGPESLNIFKELAENGVFLVPLQGNKPTFRYHRLFKEALLEELKKRYSHNTIISLYRNAAIILCEKGDYVSAIDLALDGELYEMANEWIQTYLVEIFAEGQTLLFGQWVQQLRNANFPVDINTLVLYITTLFSMHEIETANEIIEELLFKQDASQWMDGSKFIAVTKIFEIINAYVTFMKDGDLEKAKVGLLTPVNVRKERSPLYNISLKYNQFEPRILRTIAGSKGKFLPFDKIDELIQVLSESEIKERNITGFTYGLLAEILYETNDLVRASKELEIGLQYGLRFQDPGLFIPMYLLKTRIFVSEKRFEDARILLVEAMKETEQPYWIGVLYIMKAQTFLLEGKISHAQQELYKVTDYINYKIASKLPFHLSTQGRTLLAKGQTEAALQMAVRIKEGAIQEKQIGTIIEAGIFEAICHLELEQEDSALLVLHDTLSHGAQYGYYRSFLEDEAVFPLLHKYWNVRQNDKSEKFNSVPMNYVEELLQYSPFTDEGYAVFTPREMDVLQLLTKGASNSEIAHQLLLSEGSIRVYLTAIYSKIGVKSRTKAIIWAKEWLGL